MNPLFEGGERLGPDPKPWIRDNHELIATWQGIALELMRRADLEHLKEPIEQLGTVWANLQGCVDLPRVLRRDSPRGEEKPRRQPGCVVTHTTGNSNRSCRYSCRPFCFSPPSRPKSGGTVSSAVLTGNLASPTHSPRKTTLATKPTFPEHFPEAKR